MMWLVSQTATSDISNTTVPFALALDIGTSSVRAALYDERGREIEGTGVQHEQSLRTTLGGGAELETEDALGRIERVIDEALERASQLSEGIEIVTVSCFWHSLTGVDADGRAVTPVLTWADTRAAQAVEELRRLFDEKETHARTGCRLHPGYWPAKFLWLREERAESFAQAARWISLSELFMLRLFGEAETSISMASGTGLLNLHRSVWDEEMLSRLSLSAEQLPPIAASGKTFSGLKKEYALRWPQLTEARWYPAIGDGAANNIGAGAVTPERAALMVGTSGAMRVLRRCAAPASIPSELWCYRADRERVVMGGALSDGGGLYAWMRETLNLFANDEELESALEEMQPDAHGLTVLPFWAGERSTGWHAEARGAILGLTQHTRPLEILRASMESVAYRFVLIAQALDLFAPQALLIASGGALKASRVWTQMMADALGRSLCLSGVRQASSRGAVLLALEREGKIKSIEDAPALLGETFEPDMARHTRYREGLERQQKFYKLLI